MALTLQYLAIGATDSDACWRFGINPVIGYYCDPSFQTSSASTISWSAFYDINGTIPVSPTYVSDGIIVRYFDGTTLGPAVTSPCKKSQYVRGCCDNKLYKLSNTYINQDEFVIGTLIIVQPYLFCYKVVEFNSQPYLTLNAGGNYLVNTEPSNSCQYGECQPCPPTTTTTTSNVPIPGQSENECGPITLLPLGVQCNIINEPSENGYDGILSVYVTGGTTPYTVVWTLPNNSSITGNTIFNQPSGTYTVNVKDLWGDFTASTTCELTSSVDCSFDGSVIEYNTPTATPTPTPTPTPVPQPTPILPVPPPPPTATPTATPLPQTQNITWSHFKECPNCQCAKTAGWIKLNGVTIYQFNSGTPCGGPTNGGNFTITIGDVIDVYVDAQTPTGGCGISTYSTGELTINNSIYNNIVYSNIAPNDITYTLTITSGNINTINSIEIISGCNG